MKKSNILLATSTIALLATGCVKPAQDNQAIYNNTAQPTYTDATQQAGVYQPTYTDGTQQAAVYQPTYTDGTQQAGVYQPSSAGVVYEEPQPNTTVTTTGTTGQVMSGTATTYPDPYANGGSTTTPVYTDTYNTTPAVTNYPATSSSAGQFGGIQLQIAALKDYYAAEDYKNRLSLAPGLSAYVQRGAMNKVIVTGIPSMAEANRLKESRFPESFIVQGGTSGSYTPPVQPNYSTSTTSGGAYNVNNPYGTPSSSPYATSSSNSGVGVQIGAFGSRGKAQSVADAQSGQYPATVKKVGRLYKVILTGFSSRSAAKSHAGRVGGFVVSTY